MVQFFGAPPRHTARHRRAAAVLVATSLLSLAACSSSDGPGSEPSLTVDKALKLTSTTPPGHRDAGSIVWAVYRPVQTLDPTKSYDYPEQLALTTMCESVLKQLPDGSIEPGLGEVSYPSPTELQIKLVPGSTFWDGESVTSADVVASLDRARDAKTGSFWAGDLNRIEAIEAIDDRTVLIHLSEPDYWLEGFLSGTGGIVDEAAFRAGAGDHYAAPGRGVMCTGAYKLKSWNVGSDVVVERNENYWGDQKALTKEIVIRGVSDQAAIQAGMLTGEIGGHYATGAAIDVAQLSASGKVKVEVGPSTLVDGLAPLRYDGTMGDLKARKALSLALDRDAYIKQVYHGEALLPRTLANVGMWGPSKKSFAKDWSSLADPKLDIAQAKKLIDEAGLTGAPLVIASSNEVHSIQASANLAYTAANKIGLKATIKSVPISEYVTLFFDVKSRGNIDLLPTVTYPLFSDPGAFYGSLVNEGGSQNYGRFKGGKIAEILAQSRAESDVDKRAELAIQAGHMINDQLPWIPVVLPLNVQAHAASITGAPSSTVWIGGPWANLLGTSSD